MEKQERRFTTSKKILWATYILFASQIIFAIISLYKGMDSSIFIYTIPSTGGLAGATTAFYMNKSKMENVFKFKISFLEYKLKLISENPKMAKIIDKDVSEVEDALSSKIDSTMTEAINEDFEVTSF